MGIAKFSEGECLVLELRGDFRGSEESFQGLRRAAQEALAQSPRLMLDMTHVTFLDSQTLGLLVELLGRASERGGEVVLSGLTPRTGKWFQLSGLDRIFRCVPRHGAAAEAPTPRAAVARRPAVAAVDIDRMVSELRSVLGEPAEDGAPSVAEPVDESALSEIEKLIRSAEEEPA